MSTTNVLYQFYLDPARLRLFTLRENKLVFAKQTRSLKVEHVLLRPAQPMNFSAVGNASKPGRNGRVCSGIGIINCLKIKKMQPHFARRSQVTIAWQTPESGDEKSTYWPASTMTGLNATD
jgi:hypothetical protein